MSIKEAKALGYEVTKAVALTKNGRYISVWTSFDGCFGDNLPGLDHEEIQVAIIRQEANEAGI